MPTGAHAAAHPVRPTTTTTKTKTKTTTSPTTTTYSLINILIVYFLLFSSSSSSFICAQQINESDSLLKFKASLQNADAPLANWNSTLATPCSGNTGNWAGVLCFNGYVWGLQLENMALKGKIDADALIPLRFLRTLSFMGNQFEGAMPDWKKLGALKSLYLSNNQFSGSVAEDAFKGMTSLKKVHMANNKFSGPLPNSLESPKLIELRLENNQFSGAIPAISSEHLKLLNVSNNQLEGPIPEALSKMDPSSFSGNKALCGKPLDTVCENAGVPSSPSPNDTSSPKTSGKILIIIIVCVVVVLLLLILIPVLCRKKKTQAPPLGMRTLPEEATAAATATATAAATTQAQQVVKKTEQQPGKLSFVSEDRDKFDLQDLMRASAEVLGSGNFGASYKAVLVDGEALVVKRFKQMNGIQKEDFHEHMRRLGRLKHPNLLPLVAYLYRKEEKLLVFDYIHNGSLATRLHGKHSPEQPGLSWLTRFKIIKGVIKGMVYLKNELPSLTVAHGHLKSSNVLLDKDYNPVLMDYALVPVVNSAQIHQVLVAYKSPEYAQNGQTSKKTDVWCLGILILETLTGKYVAAQGSPGDIAGWINGIVGLDADQVLDKEMEIATATERNQVEKVLQIGIGCCAVDPEKRWDLDEVMRKIEQVEVDSPSFVASIINKD